ncbi:hypothetical protein ACFPL7_13685 [Dongia soli]|uniref:Lipoprotein n=1 Tax=Dongia soli TaxID=600628 RepID=A0ABU5ECE3_9PROT|nr:hypothetical protein [Dongia soli]MDY0884053.1 hypothetical protein [Dongia soli]
MTTPYRQDGRANPGGNALTTKPAPALVFVLGIGAFLALSGCQLTTGAAVYGLVEGSSLNQTGKTASDHLASLVTGQDCNILRYQQTGKYCLSSAELAQMEAAERRDNAAYCYRTIGEVWCYDNPDPTASPEIRVH